MDWPLICGIKSDYTVGLFLRTGFYLVALAPASAGLAESANVKPKILGLYAEDLFEHDPVINVYLLTSCSRQGKHKGGFFCTKCG